MNISVREITTVPTLMHWHIEVIETVFGVIPSKRLLVAARQYYRKHIADGTYFAVVAEADGSDAGCGALFLSEEPPSPANPTGLCACLIDIYVRGDFRGRGVAHKIMEWLMEKAQTLGCGRIYLQSSGTAFCSPGDSISGPNNGRSRLK